MSINSVVTNGNWASQVKFKTLQSVDSSSKILWLIGGSGWGSTNDSSQLKFWPFVSCQLNLRPFVSFQLIGC